MKELILYFKFEMLWSLLFVAGMVIEGFDWWLMTGLFVMASFILYRAANYGKN